MGYKLAGYNVIGANDIDPKMAEVYKINHNPKLYYLCPISKLLYKELDQSLYNLDILDGSPPCSTFSMAGSREKAFKKNKVFREGQQKQVLSDLFFDWIKLVDKLKPKIAIAENVKGMLQGNAIAYTTIIIQELEKIGYDVQLFCLNAASMGVPQKRERVFFICRRKDLDLPKLVLNFNEKPIVFKEFLDYQGKAISDHKMQAWKARQPQDTKLADSKRRAGMKYTDFNCTYAKEHKVLPTITSKGSFQLICYNKPLHLSKKEITLASSFPQDYNYLDVNYGYLCGMSVPPVMTAQIAHQIYLQWFKKI
ncbi:MAG: DNA cytosine methyltransferase [Patescibacteria group bacterium]